MRTDAPPATVWALGLSSTVLALLPSRPRPRRLGPCPLCPPLSILPRLPSPSPSPTPSHLLLVGNYSGTNYYSGSGAGWTIPQHSSLVSYACTYHLCSVTAPIDGTPDSPHGAAIDFAGPNYQALPYTYTIDMGQPHTFTHWRVSGQDWYRFGAVHLRYQWQYAFSLVVERDNDGEAMGCDGGCGHVRGRGLLLVGMDGGQNKQ